MDTIYALSSGIGRAAIAVVRLSGPLAETVTRALCSGALPPPRVASLRRLIRRVGDPIDQALVLWFPNPRSFTGEDSAEFHIHGGRATLKALAAALDELGCRPAEAGEFTRRAFANGRLDLTEVEGLADLINADTELQRRQALAVAGGGLGAQVQAWRATLVNLLALVEADIDFVDEADAPQVVGADVASRCAALAVEFQDHLRRAKRAEIIRDGYVVVIAGPPNAGKSSLLNALAGRDVAIVSDVPGTTRDLIEVHLDLDGIPVDLVDTAGLRASEDPVERAGMARARQRAERANLVLWLEPFGADAVGSPMAMPAGVETLHVRTKADLAFGGIAAAGGAIAVSVKDDTGIKILLDRIVARASASLGDSEGAAPIRQRQAACLARASEALMAVVADPGLPVELMAEHLRLATRHLNMLIGAIGVDDVLDEIFSRFCIGK